MALLESTTEQRLFNYALLSLLIASPLSFLSLQFLSAPYGRHRRPGWGPLLYPPLAWFLMEGPTLWLSLILFPLGKNWLSLRPLVLYSPFFSHYFHRTVIYPLRLHLRQRKGLFDHTHDRNTALENTHDRKTALGKTGFENTHDRNIALENTHDRKTALEKTHYPNTAFENTHDRNTAFEKTTFENTHDRNIAFENTIDRNTGFENTHDRKTGFENTHDRKTAFDNTADQKTAGGETVYWESDGLAHRRTGFGNTDERETAFEITADRETAFENTPVGETADWESDGLKTSDRKTASGKTTFQKTTSGFPASVALMAFSYNVWNTYLQARWVSHYADFEADEWFWWRFCVGMVVFVTGMAVNIWSDLVLLGLKSEDGKYRVPKGGLFEFVSSPNYLGEVVEWFGWALMTWSWAGVGFFLFTCSNLVPRACSNHMWYLNKFGEDYPKNRKAVIPFLY